MFAAPPEPTFTVAIESKPLTGSNGSNMVLPARKEEYSVLVSNPELDVL